MGSKVQAEIEESKLTTGTNPERTRGVYSGRPSAVEVFAAVMDVFATKRRGDTHNILQGNYCKKMRPSCCPMALSYEYMIAKNIAGA